MVSSFDRNISRLRSSEKEVARQAMSDRTAHADRMGRRGINEARDIANKLSHLSTGLKRWREQDIKDKEAYGAERYREDQVIDSKRLVELQLEIEDAERREIEHQHLKDEYLKLSGPSGYPEADRIGHLSHYQQIGYLKAKLKHAKDSYADQLEHSLATSEEAITIQGYSTTPKELHDNNLNPIAFKEAAVHIMADKLWKAKGLDKFSPELLELSGINEEIETVKTNLIDKYRNRYNVESSSETRSKAKLDYEQGPKDGKAMHLFLITNAATLDARQEQLGPAGAWKLLDAQIVNDAIRLNNLDLIDKRLNQEIPPRLAKELGVKQGTTFAQHWKNKIPNLRAAAKKQIIDAANADKEFLQSENTLLANQFDEEKRKGPISTKRLEWYEDQSYLRGGTLDTRIKNYKTLSERNKERDVKNIKARIAENRGAITHAELEEYHPEAAAEFRDQATRHEAALKKKYNVDGAIKAALNTAWTEAGLVKNEKSPEWVFALTQASLDYEEKFNKLVAMGFPSDTASYFALSGKLGTIKDQKTGEPIPEFEGVSEHIQRTGATNKYLTISKERQAEIKADLLKVDKINRGKLEMLNNTVEGKTLDSYIIGGEYGKNQIDIIGKNIEIYGWEKGIRMSEEAWEYYDGLAAGKRTLFTTGLIDAQLKAAGYPGIFPDRTAPDTEDDSGQIEAATDSAQVLKYEGSYSSYSMYDNDELDMKNYYTGGPSVYDLPWNIAPSLQQ